MIFFLGAGPGDPELMTVKGRRILEEADAVLYTGSLVPKEVLSWVNPDACIESSEKMEYDEIFAFLSKYADKNCVRLHTGDPSLFSTIARQIAYCRTQNLAYQVIPGISAAFGAAASLGIEYTIPGVTQTLILSRVEGQTPTPEPLENILKCQNSAKVFYLSIKLIDKLKESALRLGYAPQTPCWVIEKATWPEEKIYKGTIDSIQTQVGHIKGIALILLGEFLDQEETEESVLYSKK